jgi:hypothetical protein
MQNTNAKITVYGADWCPDSAAVPNVFSKKTKLVITGWISTRIVKGSNLSFVPIVETAAFPLLYSMMEAF